LFAAQAALIRGAVTADGFRCGGWNFLAVGAEDEQVGERELLAVGQVDEVTGGAAVYAGEQG
jgi:hypothetical protein